MARIHWSKEQKQEFWAAFVRHRDEGCNIREAWQRAYADFRAEGKIAPGLQTFGNWYRKAMASTENANRPTCPSSPSGPSIAEPDAEEAAPADDYTQRLEMMVRLYRRRSEADVDAVCDCLLPDLCAEEE